jgi:hypothetical protein
LGKSRQVGDAASAFGLRDILRPLSFAQRFFRALVDDGNGLLLPTLDVRLEVFGTQLGKPLPARGLGFADAKIR